MNLQTIFYTIKLDDTAWGLARPVPAGQIGELADRLSALSAAADEVATARAALDATERSMATRFATCSTHLRETAANLRRERDARVAVADDFAKRRGEAAADIMRHMHCDWFAASRYARGEARLDQPLERLANEIGQTFKPEVTDANREFVETFSAPRRPAPDSAALAVDLAQAAEIVAFVKARARYNAACDALAAALASYETSKAAVDTAAVQERETVRAAEENQAKRDASIPETTTSKGN